MASEGPRRNWSLTNQGLCHIIVDAIRFCRDLIYKHKVSPPPDVQIEGEAFTTGKASMTIGGTWNTRRFNRSRTLWNMAGIPTDTKGRSRTTAGGGMGHCIYARTTHPQEAWTLVKFLNSEVSQRGLAKSGMSVPVLKKAALSEDFLAPFDRPPKETYPLIFRNLDCYSPISICALSAATAPRT